MMIRKKEIFRIVSVIIIFALFFVIKIPKVSANSYCSGNTKVVSTSYFPCCGNPATACGAGASGCDDQNRCTWSQWLQQYPGTTCYSYDYTTCDCGCSNGSCNPCPVCGNNVVESGENCDPSGSSCTDGGNNGTCTSSCLCCVRCSVQCPAPLVESQPTGIPHPLSEYTFGDIVSCQDGADCSAPTSHPLDCYEVPSPQPTVKLDIFDEDKPTSLSFISPDHTGSGTYAVNKDDSVNDFFPYSDERFPNTNDLFHFKATFTDGDNPIEATYIWFNKEGGVPTPLQKIDLDNSSNVPFGTKEKTQFGFMIQHDLLSDNWTPYVPAISGNGMGLADYWKKVSTYKSISVVDDKTIFSLPGPNGNEIAKILIYSVSPEDNGKKITIIFSISFSDLPLLNKPVEGKYKIWLMGNDTFGFTPYDNYGDQGVVALAVKALWISNENIRYYDQWKDSGKTWNLNFKNPGLNFSITPSSSSSAAINIGWDFIPDPDLIDEFSDLVINVYKSDNLAIDPLIISNTESEGATSIDVNTPFVLDENGKSADVVGSLDKSVNHYLLRIHGGTGDGSATLTLNNVGQGILYFTVTAFDKGGNRASMSSIELDLRDWLITQGGLLYSNLIDINVEHISDTTAWGAKNLLTNIPNINAGLSTELVGIKDSLVGPVSPHKSTDTKSYMIRPFSTPDPANKYYITLKEKFNKKKSSLSIESLTSTNLLTGNLSSKIAHGGEIAVMERDGSLTVDNKFVCDWQGVFFVRDNLVIDGKIANGSVNKDACIFVVGKEVQILDGEPFDVAQLEYDEVNAYILSDGKIHIGEDNIDFNGLYISGGIHSLSNPGVEFRRSLKVADRLRFPALIVNHHSKYGILGGRLFGEEIKVQEVEVGISPY